VTTLVWLLVKADLPALSLPATSVLHRQLSPDKKRDNLFPSYASCTQADPLILKPKVSMLLVVFWWDTKDLLGVAIISWVIFIWDQLKQNDISVQFWNVLWSLIMGSCNCTKLLWMYPIAMTKVALHTTIKSN
jgi:hypothetical protein